MSDEEILAILKTDLQISADAYNKYLSNLISLSKAAIEREGIKLDENSVDECMLVEMYAAYLYRKRRDAGAVMPRALRYNLNNLLISRKGKIDNG